MVVLHRRFWLGLPRDFHGGLAVDFFFMLSGFVIAHAYGAKIAEGGMRFGEFALLRIVRLYPLVFLGAAIATGALLFGPPAIEPFANPAPDVPPDALTVLMALPFNLAGFPTWFFYNSPFDPNFPVWSLFFEIIANFVFALGVAALPLRRLVYLTSVFAALLLALIVGSTDFGRVGTNWPTIAAGMLRVAFPFCAGVLIQRLHAVGRLRMPELPFGILAAALLAVLVMPISYNHVVEAVYLSGAIFIAFPLIVAAGAAAEPGSRIMGCVTFSGFVSYPLYVLHAPILMWFDRLLPLPGLPGVLHMAIVLPLTTGLAWLAGRLYDLPVRKKLGEHLRRRASQVAGTP